MTIKEIAELCSVSDQTVLNWIHKPEVLNQKIWLRISEKLEHGSPEHPSDYDLGETLEIISEGGGNKALASLLAENAANKNALIVQSGRALDRITELEKKVTSLLETPPLTPREQQLRALKTYLHQHLEITGDKRDRVDVYDFYWRYKGGVENSLTRDEFPLAVTLILPELRVKRGRYFTDIIGCRSKS
jgi:hypothetical protein